MLRIVRVSGVDVAAGVNTSWRGVSEAPEDAADRAERKAQQEGDQADGRPSGIRCEFSHRSPPSGGSRNSLTWP